MPKISPISWKKFEKFLLFVGCNFDRQRGDHRIYWRTDLRRPCVITQDKQLPIFIIRNNLRVLGISHEEYLEILNRL